MLILWSRYLEKRLVRGDRGINSLDAACREHDITHSRNKDLTKRHIADKILAEEARKQNLSRKIRLLERESCCHSVGRL